jgi:hypothetical protein
MPAIATVGPQSRHVAPRTNNKGGYMSIARVIAEKGSAIQNFT